MLLKILNDILLNNPFIKSISYRFPVLKKLRRSFIACKDSTLPRKKTYSQSGEDIIVSDAIQQYSLKPSEYIYIDIGANQPTQISNTYLFYRLGYRGIVVEPNRQLQNLFNRYRPGDTFLNVGCADHSGLGRFLISESTSVSGFTDSIKLVSKKFIWVPILTVDEIWRKAGEEKRIILMSIDTEGYDLKVLMGAKEALTMTMCLIVEIFEDNILELNEFLIKSGFKLFSKTENNLIWVNENQII
jgi:FkbM family methyltransferase